MDFLAIGSTVVDTFIKLKDATVNCDINNERCTITMRWGDKIPFELAVRVPAVGNAPNAAVAAARLGLSSGLLSVLGHDRDGADCLEHFKAEHVATDLIEVKEDVETSNNYVLWYDAERTILVRDAAFQLKFPNTLPVPRTAYLSRIGDADTGLYDEVADWIEKNPAIMVAFQPGTSEIKAGLSRLARIYRRSDIFFANKEEYQRILGSAAEDPRKLMDFMHEKGPKICVLTDGPKGAFASDGVKAYRVPPYPDPKPPYERTGAGDAFSSTIAIALTLGKSLSEALAWGPVNSMSVVQYIGAQEGLLSREKLEEYLKTAPEGYKVVPI